MGRSFVSCFVSLLFVAQAAAQQTVFGSKVGLRPYGVAEHQVFEPYRNDTFSPVGELSALAGASFTTLEHPAFPNYSVRIKRSKFCDEQVDAYTGYIDIEARHLFFYFFESRNDPVKDDVIFWTNGGPGCSSALGLFMELGPCRVNSSDEKAIHHPEAWNTNANVFFVDQPIGVGFSYADYGETVGTTEEAAVDIAAFIAIFFENFSQFKGRALHMAGESYGGRYIPVFASAVYDQNAYLTQAGIAPINLQSIMIGNGVTHFVDTVLSLYDMQCTAASVPPILDISTCVRMKQALTRCVKWTKTECLDRFDAMNCGASMNFCETEIQDPFWETGKNPYDISKDCDGPIGETLCYPVTKYITQYLDRPDVRSSLGVDPSIGNFTSCSSSVGHSFNANLDEYHQTQLYVGALLEHGVRALIYVGSYDWICNWVGNQAWTLTLDWSGKEEFRTQELRDWTVGGISAGKTRSAKGLTFATISGAGHMVPYDKPKEALAMVNRWLAEEDL